MRLTDEQYQEFLKRRGAAPTAAPVASKARSKYGAVPTVVDDKRFDSKLEARRYEALTLLWKAGEILWFLRQVPFDLPGGRKYRADFLIVWMDGRTTVEDCKGFDTEMSKLKRAQVEELYGIKIELVRAA